jgi:hypothetical protein
MSPGAAAFHGGRHGVGVCAPRGPFARHGAPAIARALLLAVVMAAPGAATPGQPLDPDVAAAARTVLLLLPLPPQAAAAGSAEHGPPPPGHAERRRLALQLAQSHRLTLEDDWPIPAAAVDCYVLRVAEDQSAAAVAAALSRRPGVAWAQPMHVYRPRSLSRSAPPSAAASAAPSVPPSVSPSARPSATPTAGPSSAGPSPAGASRAGASGTDPAGGAAAEADATAPIRSPTSPSTGARTLGRAGSGRPPGTADPLAPLQPAVLQWRLDELHRSATGRQVRVAVIDSAVDTGHPDLVGQVVLTEDFVDPAAPAGELHGTAVAGLIAARAGDGQGIVGVAPQARLLGLRACREGRDGLASCTTLALAKALEYALEEAADVINLSLAGPSDRLLARLIDAARDRGATVVAPRDPSQPDGGFPAAHPGVLAVVEDGQATAGAWPAPARDLPAPVPRGGWALVSGPSYAAAEVSGLVALLRELQPRGDARFAPRPALLPGGRLDACATLSRAAGACVCGCATGASPGATVRH